MRNWFTFRAAKTLWQIVSAETSRKPTPPWKAINCFAIEFNNLLYSDNEIREEQRADNDILSIIKTTEDINNANDKKEVPLEYRKDMHKLLLKDGILYYNYHGKHIIVAPKNFRSEILKLSHCNYLSGHFGIFKTHHTVLTRFWWPQYFPHVSRFVSDSLFCLKTISDENSNNTMAFQTIRFYQY